MADEQASTIDGFDREAAIAALVAAQTKDRYSGNRIDLETGYEPRIKSIEGRLDDTDYSDTTDTAVMEGRASNWLAGLKRDQYVRQPVSRCPFGHPYDLIVRKDGSEAVFCRACKRAYDRQYAKTHAEKRRAYQRSDEYKEKKRERDQRYRDKARQLRKDQLRSEAEERDRVREAAFEAGRYDLMAGEAA